MSDDDNNIIIHQQAWILLHRSRRVSGKPVLFGPILLDLAWPWLSCILGMSWRLPGRLCVIVKELDNHALAQRGPLLTPLGYSTWGNLSLLSHDLCMYANGKWNFIFRLLPQCHGLGVSKTPGDCLCTLDSCYVTALGPGGHLTAWPLVQGGFHVRGGLLRLVLRSGTQIYRLLNLCASSPYFLDTDP